MSDSLLTQAAPCAPSKRRKTPSRSFRLRSVEEPLGREGVGIGKDGPVVVNRVMRHAHGRAGWDFPISIRQGTVGCYTRYARCHAAVGKTEAFLYESGEVLCFLKLFQIRDTVVMRLDIVQLCSEFLEHGGLLA